MNHLSLPDTEQKSCCLLVEDQETTRIYLQDVLRETFRETSTFSFATLKEARAWLNQRQGKAESPELKFALIDLGLPDGSGIEIVRYLAQHHPAVPPVVFTVYDDDSYLFGAFAAGAQGYILKDDPISNLTDLLGRIQRGEPPLSPSIARRLISHFRTAPKPDANEVSLTPREQETLTLIAKGFTVAEAAAKMSLSAQTVAGYVKIIYQKLHISSRAEATHEAIRRGLA